MAQALRNFRAVPKRTTLIEPWYMYKEPLEPVEGPRGLLRLWWLMPASLFSRLYLEQYGTPQPNRVTVQPERSYLR